MILNVHPAFISANAKSPEMPSQGLDHDFARSAPLEPVDTILPHSKSSNIHFFVPAGRAL